MWQLKPVDEKRLSTLKEATDLPEGILRALLLRGVASQKEVFGFLYPDLKNLHPNSLLPQIEPALERIITALRQKEKILIWGHEDMDGIASTVLLKEVLSDLRGEVIYFIPRKHEFKHGIYPPKVLEYPQINLVIAVDCGTTNRQEIGDLKERGIDTVIIDHHEAYLELPPAVAIVNPKLPESKYPFCELAAVGTVFKFATALLERVLGIGVKEFVSSKPESLILSALGSISDKVPLIDENRIIVREGLARFKESRRPPIEMISQFEETSTIFSLFGAIEGNEVARFLLTREMEEARAIFDKMVLGYEDFKREINESISLAETVKDLAPGIVIVKNIFLSLRALGYIATRFKERYHLPVIVIGKKDGIWVAECRGLEEINLLELLREESHLLIDWGGHKKACGFSIAEENLEEFIRRAKEYAEREFLPAIEKPQKIFHLDALLPLSEITEEVFLLPPFGEGNPQPFFLSPATKFDKRTITVNGREVPILDETGRLVVGNRYNLIYTVNHLGIHIKEVEMVE